MKTTLLKTKKTSAAMIATVSLASLGLSQQGEAGVTWLVSEVGNDLHISTDGGTLDVGTSTGITVGGGMNTGDWSSSTSTVHTRLPTFYLSSGIGSVTNDPWVKISSSSTTNITGHTFGHSVNSMYWDTSFGESPGSMTPISSMVFDNLTAAEAFGTSLDSGPVVIWTHSETGDTISVAMVPEPSSAALLGLGAVAGLLRRRR